MPKFCPQCGKPVDEASKFCNNCGAILTTAAPVEQKGSDLGIHEEKSPSLAVLCSFFIPGLGQVYDGETARGMAIFVGTLVGIFIFFIPGVIVWIYGMYDAYSTAKKMNNREIPFKPTKTAHMIIFFLLAALVIAVVVFLVLMAILAAFVSALPHGSTIPIR
jgi:TM2 domain-containing membrane protein YozV/predicted nucleic acid-binding Zn ribbon protein